MLSMTNFSIEIWYSGVQKNTLKADIAENVIKLIEKESIQDKFYS